MKHANCVRIRNTFYLIEMINVKQLLLGKKKEAGVKEVNSG